MFGKDRCGGTEFLVRADAILERNLERKLAHVAVGRNAPIRTAGLIPPRNGLCPCGSGAKYKKCCRARVPYVGVPLPSQDKPIDFEESTEAVRS